MFIMGTLSLTIFSRIWLLQCQGQYLRAINWLMTLCLMLCDFRIDGMRVFGDPIAPIKHLSLSEPSTDRDIDNCMLAKITKVVGMPY